MLIKKEYPHQNKFMTGFANNSENTMINLKFLKKYDDKLPDIIYHTYTTPDKKRLFELHSSKEQWKNGNPVDPSKIMKTVPIKLKLPIKMPSPIQEVIPVKKGRCPNGTRKNKSTGNCEPSNKKSPLKLTIPKKATPKKSVVKRCPKGTRRNKKNGQCEQK